MKFLFGITLLIFVSLQTFSQEEKPNILMIAVDDLNDWVGVYDGNPQAITPHIDKLAQKGMVFHNASCPGPVCGPSRSALLSGFMPATTGIYGNKNNMRNSKIVQTHATLPEYFSKHGYITISSGKIFHKHGLGQTQDHGQWAYDIWEKETGNNSVDPSTLYSRHQGILNGEKVEGAVMEEMGVDLVWGATQAPKEETKDYRTAKWFEEKLQQDYEKPFFMIAGISKPHLPFVVPQEYFDLYNLDTIKVPEYRLDDLDDIVDKNGKKRFDAHTDFLWVTEQGIHKEAVRAYLAAGTYADACVGVMLNALAKSKYADNTIVILWGDHGWHLGEKLKFRKASLWKESTQLPFIIHTPGMDKKQDCVRNVNLIDIYPTLIDLCGLPEKELDGQSIQPLLENPKTEWTPTITTLKQGNHSVMSEKWHYINYNGEMEELYNLENDPMEWNNLANKNTSEIESIKKRMKSYLPDHNAIPVTKSSVHLYSPDEKRNLQQLK